MLQLTLKLSPCQYAHQIKGNICLGLEEVLLLVFHLSKVIGSVINNGNKMALLSWIRNVIDNLYHLNDSSLSFIKGTIYR